jgi:glycosyltransferase involved in cell wall biosynthesis
VSETVVDGVTGFLTPRATGAFAKLLVNMLSDESLRRRLGRSGRDHVDHHWSWPLRASALESVLISTARAAGKALP